MNTLTDIRISLDMTQDAAAKAAGITRTTLSRIEAGKAIPHQLTIAALARAYGSSVEEIRAAIESSAAVG